jgi:hypothetical protein
VLVGGLKNESNGLKSILDAAYEQEGLKTGNNLIVDGFKSIKEMAYLSGWSKKRDWHYEETSVGSFAYIVYMIRAQTVIKNKKKIKYDAGRIIMSVERKAGEDTTDLGI